MTSFALYKTSLIPDDQGTIYRVHIPLYFDPRSWGDEEQIAKSQNLPEGTRWITLHPNGKDEKGVRVMIKESAAEKGAYYIVGGAGNKLNHMKLTGVKSEEEYKADQKAKQKKKREEKKAEERELAASGQLNARKRAEEAIEEASKNKRKDLMQQYVMKQVEALGLNPKDYVFTVPPHLMPNADSDAGKAALAMAEYRFYQKVITDINAIITSKNEQLLSSEEERAIAGEGAITLKKPDRTIDVEQAHVDMQEADNRLGELQEILDRAIQADDDRMAAVTNTMIEEEEERFENAKTIIERNSGVTVDTLEGKKVKQGTGYNNQSKQRAIEGLIENGTLQAKPLRDTAKNDEEAQALLANIYGLAASEGGQPAVYALAEQEMKKRKELLNQAADLLDEGDEDGAYTAWKKAETILAKWGEKADRASRKANGDGDPAEYLQLVYDATMRAREAAAVASELSKNGATKPPEELKKANVEYEDYVELRKNQRQLQAMLSQLDKKSDEAKGAAAQNAYVVDSDLIADKFHIDENDEKIAEAQRLTEEEIKAAVIGRINASLIKEVEESEELMNQLDLSKVELQRAMKQHISSGAYAGFAGPSLIAAGDTLLDRAVIDTLGIKGASQLLAQHLKDSLDDDHFQALIDGLEVHHSTEGVDLATEALNQARDAYDEANQITFGDVEDATDLRAMQYLNDKRRNILEDTMHNLGHTIGLLRSQAEMLNALKRAKPSSNTSSLQVSMGDAEISSIIQQMAAAGLVKGDYGINKDEKGNRVLSLNRTGMQKLVRSDLTQEEINAAQIAQSIKTGAFDESGWMPQGIARRTKSTLNPDSPDREAPKLALDPQTLSNKTGAEFKQSMLDYIGSRVADGESVEDITGDILSASFSVLNLGGYNSEQTKMAQNLMDSLFPAPNFSDEPTAKEIREFETARKERGQLLAEKFRDRNNLSTDPIHMQSVDMGDHTREAVHLALSKNPTATLAFTPTQDLSAKDRGALRVYFWKNLTSEGRNAVANAKTDEEKKQLEEMENSISMFDMFGDVFSDANIQSSPAPTPSPEEEKENAVFRSAWGRYVASHANNPDLAIQSIQEHIKGEFNNHFATYYGRLTKKPLKKASVAFSAPDSHSVGLLDEAGYREKKDQLLSPLRQRMASIGRQSDGRFGAGAKAEVASDSLRMEAENQMQMVDTAQAQGKVRRASAERTSLGDRAERQIGSMINAVRHTWNPKADPIGIFAPSMGDDTVNDKGEQPNKKFYKQQRAIKLIRHSKRIGLFFGAGSGKTLTMLGAFADLNHTGDAQRAILAVPSVVQKQFGGEAIRFLDPTHKRRDGRTGYQWFAEAGASKEERHAAYRDQSKDFMVITHQAVRDDALDAVSSYLDMDRDGISDYFNGLPRKERASLVKKAFDHMGWHNFDMMGVDEAHYISNRQGKEDSTMANVMDAIGDNMTHHILATGTPVKNDASEAFDYLSKLDPDRFSDRSVFMRQFGGNTQSQTDALQRITARYFYQDKVSSGVSQINGTPNPLQLSPNQEKAYNEVERAYNNLRLARQQAKKQGTEVDPEVLVNSMRVLSPNSFANMPADEHLDKAKKLLPAYGTIRDSAYNRVINGGRFEDNSKMQRVLEIANENKAKGRAGVVFARNLDSVAELKRGLEAAGHRVAVLTGTMSGDEKNKARTAFAPESGNPDHATADILLLSDAGNTGLNLQRGKWLAHIDTPYTGPVKEQRDARIDRLGQTEDVEIHQLLTNTPFDGKAARRLQRKQLTSHVFQNPADALDDSGLAGQVHDAYRRITGKQRMAATATGENQRERRRAAVEQAATGKAEGQRKRKQARTSKKQGGRATPTKPSFDQAIRGKEAISQLIGAYKQHVPTNRWNQVEEAIRQGVGKRGTLSNDAWVQRLNDVADEVHEFITEYYE